MLIDIYFVTFFIFLVLLFSPTMPAILKNGGRSGFFAIVLVSYIGNFLGVNNVAGIARATHVVYNIMVSCLLVSFAEKYFWTLRFMVPLGYLSNAAAILSNNLYMPVDSMATVRMVSITSLLPQLDGYHIITNNTGRLLFLSDWIYHPVITASHIMSIGDILIAVGYPLALVQILLIQLRRPTI